MNRYSLYRKKTVSTRDKGMAFVVQSDNLSYLQTVAIRQTKETERYHYIVDNKTRTPTTLGTILFTYSPHKKHRRRTELKGADYNTRAGFNKGTHGPGVSVTLAGRAISLDRRPKKRGDVISYLG